MPISPRLKLSFHRADSRLVLHQSCPAFSIRTRPTISQPLRPHHRLHTHPIHTHPSFSTEMLSNAIAGPSTSRPSSSLPIHLPSSPRLTLTRTRRLSLPTASSPAPPPPAALSRPPMDYFSLPIPLYQDEDEDESALADSDSEDEDAETTLSTTSSQRSFYGEEFNYTTYRTGLALPGLRGASPSFGFDDSAVTAAAAPAARSVSSASGAGELERGLFIEHADLLPSPSSTVGSDYTLADSAAPSPLLYTFSHSHSPPSSCSSFSSGHEDPHPITPPKYEISLPAEPRQRRMAFNRYVPTPSRRGKVYVHVDTPYPDDDEEEEEEEMRGRAMQRQAHEETKVLPGRGFELVLGGGGTLADRRRAVRA